FSRRELKRMERELVVPWSRAMMHLSMRSLLSAFDGFPTPRPPQSGLSPLAAENPEGPEQDRGEGRHSQHALARRRNVLQHGGEYDREQQKGGGLVPKAQLQGRQPASVRRQILENASADEMVGQEHGQQEGFEMEPSRGPGSREVHEPEAEHGGGYHRRPGDAEP